MVEVNSTMGLVTKDDGWRIPDKLWDQMKPLIPPSKKHRFSGHRPPVDPRDAMNAIFFVLRTGCQWNALNSTGICSSSSAHRWFQRWTKAGVFTKFWRLGLEKYDTMKGIDWRWQSMDGAMTKAPLGGGKNRQKPHGSGKIGRQEKRAH